MHTPAKVDVFIEGAVEFDFEGVGERGRVLVRVVLSLLAAEGEGNIMEKDLGGYGTRSMKTWSPAVHETLFAPS